MFTEKKTMPTGAINMTMSTAQMYAMVDYFAPDRITGSGLLKALLLSPDRLDDREFMMQGYAELISDKVLEIRFDNTIGVHALDADDPMTSLMGLTLGRIISEMSTYTELEVMLGRGIISMVIIESNDGYWASLWKAKTGIGLIGGFSRSGKPQSVKLKIAPFINKANNNSQPLNISIKQQAMDGSIIMATSMYGDSNVYHEIIPDNKMLTRNTEYNMKSYDGSEFIYNENALNSRIIDVLEVM